MQQSGEPGQVMDVSSAFDGAENVVGTGITMASSWTFAGVAPVFLDHVRQSVPTYDATHDLVADISTFFCRSHGRYYDLGTSTGQLLARVMERNARLEEAEWIGFDNEPEMVRTAIASHADRKNVRFEAVDVADVELESCDFVTAFLILQFLPPQVRQSVLGRVHEALRPGGALMVFEKIRIDDARIGDVVSSLYWQFKESMGLSSEEILNKARSLAGVLEPFSSERNLELITGAGFRSVAPIVQFLCFEGYLAVK